MHIKLLSETKLAAGLGLVVVPQVAHAFKFEPIERDQMPDKSSAAVTHNGLKPDFATVRKDVDALIHDRLAKGPTLVHLAWYSSGTYAKMKRDGGSNSGTIRFKEELSPDTKAGLETAMTWLDRTYKKYNKVAHLTYADLCTLAGEQAIE